ncbi:MAG: hypothetical protein ACYTX0_34310 [Nostoc sp.]
MEYQLFVGVQRALCPYPLSIGIFVGMEYAVNLDLVILGDRVSLNA